jgi:signal transduction histidine kinase
VPQPVEGPNGAPPVLITELKVAGLEQPVSAVGEPEFALGDIPADRSQLQVKFVGLSFAPGEVLQYQLMLEGADRDWSRPTDQRLVTYPRVAPGSYRLLVRALNSEGVPSSRPAVITFTVLPPLWQRWWFITLLVLSAVGAAFLLYRYRVARILELVNVRTRIASDLHDDIGANLTKISILSEVARQNAGNLNAEKDSPLTSIAQISRESVAAMSDIVWAINPQRDSLRDLVRRMRQHAEEGCLAQEIDLEFTARPSKSDLKLHVDLRRDLYLIFKEALNNAMRHSDCSRLQIEISEEQGILHLMIRDNGKGFDPQSSVSGNGLINMRRRVQIHNGSIEIKSQARETTIDVRLPHRASRRFVPTQTGR